MHYVGHRKPVEELYDCEADPWNVNNLAGSPEHQAKLRELRDASLRHIQQTRDLGFLPENYAWSLVGKTAPWDFARGSKFDHVLSSAWTANSVAGLGESHAAALLQVDSAVARYWGVMGLLMQSKLQASSIELLKELLNDDILSVRIEAAGALARHGEETLALPKLIELLKHDDLNVVLHATRTVEMLGKRAFAAEAAMRAVAKRSEKLQASTTQAVFDQSGTKDLAMFCSFSANGFLDRLHQGSWEDLLKNDTSDSLRSAWANVTDGVRFSAEESEVEMLSKGKNLWIVHNKVFNDFELTLDARMPADDYNAGIGFRCELLPNGRPRGYQCEVADDLSGSLYAIGSGGWVWPKGDNDRTTFFEQAGNAFRRGRWNHFRIRCEGKSIKIWVNGILTTDVTDEKHQAGRIALQHHGKGGPHRYRNAKIRSLRTVR